MTMLTIMALVLLALILGSLLTSRPKTRTAGRVILSFLLFGVIALSGLIASFLIALTTARSGLYVTLLLSFGLLLFIWLLLALWGVPRPQKIRLPLLGGMAVCILAAAGFLGSDAYTRSVPRLDESDNLIYSYAPYAGDSKVVVLQEPATLALEGELPRLDGATALFPIYSAFARAVYPPHELTPIEIFDKSGINIKDLLLCTTTPNAYQRLIDGDADMIFVASASKQQQEAAAKKGVELIFTPIGREAFVFFVNARNPVDSLTLEQLQGIYAGEITGWGELGTPLTGSIKAFQRPEGSGSQTTLQKLMEGRGLVTPPQEDIVSGMGGMISQTADYRNFRNAIGYSFRFYSTEMVRNNQIKLLAVNGIQPSKETIRDGSYPIASEFYAVTTQSSAPLCRKLLEWILSAQGQWIIEQTGYVGVS